MKDANKINFIIDTFIFLTLAAIAGTGFLIKHIGLLSKKLSTTFGGKFVITFLNLIHHEWGRIHFILSVIFLALLLVHIILHWRWIATTYQSMFKNKFAKAIIAILLLAIIVVLFTFAFWVKPEIKRSPVKAVHSCTGKSNCAICGPKCPAKNK